jgi:DNA-binding HxlR family transcriptional regulator
MLAREPLGDGTPRRARPDHAREEDDRTVAAAVLLDGHALARGDLEKFHATTLLYFFKVRSYSQFCPLATALDTVGDRWTLLVVRELLLGPKRYGELAAALPGMGTNLLAERLRRLQAEDVIRRTGAPGYELTERGRDLEPAVLALARWGLPLLPTVADEERLFRPEWLMLSLQAMFRPEEAADVSETWEYRIGGQVFWLRVDNGTLSAGAGAGEDPALVWMTDPETFRALGARELSPAEALAAGQLRVEGDAAALQRALRIVPPPGG